MARPASAQPTDGELEILNVLWERGPSGLKPVCDGLRQARPVATTTVATMLKLMQDNTVRPLRPPPEPISRPAGKASASQGG